MSLNKKLLILILVFTALTRLIRLDYPNQYVFDEVYHAFTAKEYLKGSKEAWEWWTKPPPNVAYEWTHPPLAKELMTTSMFIVGSTNAWAWRLPGALLGILSVYLIYLIGFGLFKNQTASLISAFLFSIEGLNFVQSRTGMNDIYFVTFMLLSFLFFVKRNYFLSAIFLGLTISSKWAGVYLFLIYPLLLIMNKRFYNLIYFIFIPPIIYFASYLPFFLLGHNLETFKGLQQQMWWYHTSLKATHDYASPWWSWPLNLYPVWYFVQYHKDSISNIFASGNPLLFWSGTGAILLTVIDIIRLRSVKLFTIILAFLAFWLPWALSPRIMFLYHYSPTVPFLCLALGYQLSNFGDTKRDRIILFTFLGLMLLGFLFVYPMLTGIPLPKWLMQYFFKTNLTKDPF